MRSDELLDGRYRLVERLGTGGMSVVWRGLDEVLGRHVAVKVLASRLADDETFRRRILAEAQAAARLSHPNIATIYDYGESVGSAGAPLPYVVMELVDGEPMASRLAGNRALPWPVAVAAVAQVAAALAEAHAHGVVHRDVTPANVMLTPAGAKVVDFGISALVGERDAEIDGCLLGTPAYLAPERMDGQPVAPATDVYALGLLLYRALTGRLPWQIETTTQMLRAHRYAEPPPLSPVDGLPEHIAALSRRCLAKDPADRPTSGQVAAELSATLDALPTIDLGPVPGEGPAGTAHTGPLLPSRRTRPLSTSVHEAVPTGARPTRPRTFPARWAASARRRAEAVLVSAGLLLVSGLAWAATLWSPGGDEAGRSRNLALGAGQTAPTCEVEYRMRQDTGQEFTASITVRNTGSQPLQAWALTFDLPGDQRITGGTGGDWNQHGRTVTARAGHPDEDSLLRPDGTAQLSYSAGYRGANPLPDRFALNGNECTAVLHGTATAAQAGGAGGGAGNAEGRGADKGGAADKADGNPGRGGGKGRGRAGG